MVKIAFIGNPNAGKSTWINYLSNSNLKVANYSGVSVEEETTDLIYKNELLTFIDLPGIYDLDVTSGEERYTKQYLDQHKIDLIVNVIDVRDLKRSLHLTAQLKQLQIPIMVLLNFVDDNINRKEMKKLSQLIKTPILFSVLKEKDLILNTMLEVKEKEVTPSFNEKLLQFLNVEGTYKNYNLDRYLLSPIFGIPILICILILSIGSVYYLSTPLSNLLNNIFEYINIHYIIKFESIIIVDQMLQSIWFTFASMISFVPFLFGIFFLLAYLEESGYIARIAYLLDGVMHLFHLSGKSVIPLLIGFGCNVPAIMATRTIPNKKERVACALMIPFISCSAKLPIFLLFIGVFFPTTKIFTLLLLYALSIFVSLFVGAILSMKQGKDEIFILELPSYAIPKFKLLINRAFKEIKHFLKKVSKVMIISMLLLTFIFPMLQGKSFQSLFTPLGFSQSREAVESIPFGLISKENLVVYYATKKGNHSLNEYVANLWDHPNEKLKALCYLLYLSMSIPCVMTLATIKSEFGKKVLILSIIIMLVVPYILSLIIYQLLSLFPLLL